jgi:hypothetical protein
MMVAGKSAAPVIAGHLVAAFRREGDRLTAGVAAASLIPVLLRVFVVGVVQLLVLLAVEAAARAGFPALFVFGLLLLLVIEALRHRRSSLRYEGEGASAVPTGKTGVRRRYQARVSGTVISIMTSHVPSSDAPWRRPSLAAPCDGTRRAPPGTAGRHGGPFARCEKR